MKVTLISFAPNFMLVTVADNQSRQNPIKEEPKLLGPNGLQIRIQRPRKCQKNNI